MVAVDLAVEVPVAVGKIPSWAKNFISEGEVQKVEKAIEKVETTTAAEVVAMVVRRSSPLGHVPFQVTLILLVSILVFEIPQMDFFTDWNLTWLFLLLSAACYGFATVIAKNKWVQRVLIPRNDQKFQVDERAQLEFFLNGLTGTTGKTGVLIFVSLLERRAVILADKSISSKLPAETWDHILKDLVGAIKAGRRGDGLSSAIQKVGSIVSEHFPVQKNDANELQNHLIIKE